MFICFKTLPSRTNKYFEMKVGIKLSYSLYIFIMFYNYPVLSSYQGGIFSIPSNQDNLFNNITGYLEF